jgi:hypothetical protein
MEITTIEILKNTKEGYCLINIKENEQPLIAYNQVINKLDDNWKEMPIEEAEALVKQWEIEHPIEEVQNGSN